MPEMNQSPDFSGFNAYSDDPFLKLVTFTLNSGVKESLGKIGNWAGRAETLKLGKLANEFEPQLLEQDAKGNRLDQVEFHPAWHALMRKGVEHGLHNSIWQEETSERGVKNLARAARVYITSGVEMGHLCPLIMTNASVAVLKHNAKLYDAWLPKILTNKYDPSQRAFSRKAGVSLGMGMTERQGGSDVRTNETVAVSMDDGQWRINGQKWFMSAPMCDGFVVLAQTVEGIGAFLIPRLQEDGSANGLEFQRLKDKLGNRSNASSEVEFKDCMGQMIGKPGQGIRTMMDMVSLTRLDCAVSSAGLMRTCLAEAVDHCRYRKVFGEYLIDQPVMQRVLSDMAIDVAAATALCFRLAKAFDRAPANPTEAAYVRLMTSVIKYWVCKMAPMLVYETMECLGGNGYVETGNLARHYREAPLNAIWEGSGNVMCLDLLRILKTQPETLGLVLESLKRDMNEDHASKLIEVIHSASGMVEDDPGSARILIEQIAYTAAAAELQRLGAGEVAGAFLETRLGGLWRNTYGMLDNRHDCNAILHSSFPDFRSA
ncbi:MAG: acyl-CoA dehydrogenase family protein [Pseudomonadota bacterium]